MAVRTFPNFDILETFEDYNVPWRCDLTPGMPRVRNGYYELPTGRWGVEVDEDLIRAHPEKDAKLNMFTFGWEEVMCKTRPGGQYSAVASQLHGAGHFPSGALVAKVCYSGPTGLRLTSGWFLAGGAVLLEIVWHAAQLSVTLILPVKRCVPQDPKWRCDNAIVQICRRGYIGSHPVAGPP